MKLAALLTLLALLTGCREQAFKQDPVPSPIDAGYPSAEIHACGRVWNGLAVCETKGAAQFSFAVQGYGDGTIRVVSRDCQMDISRRYAGSEALEFSADLSNQRQCLFSVQVTPSFPRNRQGDVVVRGYRGHLAVRSTKSEQTWWGETRKVSGPFKSSLSVPVHGGAPALVVLKGCGRDYESERPVEQGKVTIPLEAAVELAEKGLCVLDGFVMTDSSEIDLNVVIAQYAPSFVPLAIPKVSFSGKKVTVAAEDVVGALLLDREIRFANAWTFKTWKKPFILRAITAGGRTVIGVGSEKEGLTWTQ